VLIASRQGYRNACRLVTQMKLRAAKGEGALALEELDGATSGLVALGGPTLLASTSYGVGGLLDRLVGLFGRSNVYVELQRHLLRDEEADNHTLRALASAYRVPVIATNGVHFASPDERPLYDVLTCVRHKTTLERAGRRLARNAERYLKPPAVMAQLFADVPEAVRATTVLAERLTYTMGDLGYRFPEYPVPAGETMPSFLRKLTEVGAHDRYRPFHDKARLQLERELQLIEKLDLAGYFLIVWDLVNFCRQRGILVQGRGSAANSAVCYSLGITAVDPVGMELLFERFLSEERGEWPDIDLDLPSGDRREEVIQYVYERYGRLGAAMTANVITYRGRSAAREVGRVLGLDAARVDRLAKAMSPFEWRDAKETLDRHLIDAGERPDDATMRCFAELWRRIQHLPRHLGQHSGGMVVCQGRLDEVVPLENAAMPGRVVIQWDKDDCADMGIVKVDLLGLGMMAVLQDALAIVNSTVSSAGGQSGGSEETAGFLDLARLPPDDPTVYRMLQAADTVGVFQVESRAQMATLPRLKPACFYDLVVEVALIRPGPIVGQMVHPYLRRRAGREPVSYAHPRLEPILARTLGVPLFQEQLLRMAMAVAGFTGGQAEELRRAMGFKRSEERMRQIEGGLRAGMAREGITGSVADDIVRSITSFALYGFPESHAASFALLVYASAYLKAHYPAAFYTGLLNNQPMGFYHPATLVKDAQRHGVRFASIDVQRSGWHCTVQPDGAVRLGLMYVRGLREECGRRIERGADETPSIRCPKCGTDDARMLERVQASTGPRWFCNTCAHDWQGTPTARKPIEGRFRSIEHLVDACGLRRDEVATLAEIGALNAFGYERRGALWQIERVSRPAGELLASADADDAGPVLDEPDPSPLYPMTLTERVVADYEGTGLTIGPHPMALRRQELALRGVLRAVDLPRGRQGRRVRTAGAVITRQRPGTAKGFVFLTLEDETGIANIIVHPEVFDRQRLVIVSEPFVVVEGILQVQEGVTSIKAEQVVPLASTMPPVDSHDFR
jgi:error-prone DNA polymerase